ncbi:MAG: thioredoxin family protein [Verrucomicrobiae bacterium]|nr:thioredoxin family protein [Verrucomicrobiae bacterium]
MGSKKYKIIVGLSLILLIVAALVAKHRTRENAQVTSGKNSPVQDSSVNPQLSHQNDNRSSENKLPELIDLGADKCIPCKMMAPVLEELKRDYSNKFKVEFIDVWKNPSEANKFNIRLIPTQIFMDANGKELFRHEGFYSKDEILNKWRELGVKIN